VLSKHEEMNMPMDHIIKMASIRVSYVDYSKLVCRINGTYRCVVCSKDTDLILISKHAAVCSTECVDSLVMQGPKPGSGHWLTEK